jgi:hypothetical protein
VDCGILALDTFSGGASVLCVGYQIYCALVMAFFFSMLRCLITLIITQCSVFLWGLGCNLIASIKHLASAHFPPAASLSS